MAPRVSSMRRAVRNEITEFKHFLVFLWESFWQFCYWITLPATRRLLSRQPTPPIVEVQDTRANRIRFSIESSYSSPFNVELFEIEWAPCDDSPMPEWNSIGFSDIQERTVARLKADTHYSFRVRAKSDRGIGGWCATLTAKTRQEPVDGGGHGPQYQWSQSPTDVTISFALPGTTTKHDVSVKLKPEHLTVLMKSKGSGQWDEVLMDGTLYGKVQTFENGSFWELVKEDGKLMLNIMLEKRIKSMAPKFDYWRSIHPGQPDLEIDTHKLETPDSGMQQINPGTMDPHQLRSMGLGQYARPE